MDLDSTPDGPGAPASGLQPEFRVNLTLAVTDLHALWTAAAAKLLAAPDMTLDDVLDVIGPREDPSVADCIATLAKPIALTGCVMDDFWIDCLRGSPPRIDLDGAVLDFKLTAGDRVPRRQVYSRTQMPHLALCMMPPVRDDAQTN